MVYNGYYKVMSNIPKMGQLPTPEICWPEKASLASLDCGVDTLRRAAAVTMKRERADLHVEALGTCRNLGDDEIKTVELVGAWATPLKNMT